MTSFNAAINGHEFDIRTAYLNRPPKRSRRVSDENKSINATRRKLEDIQQAKALGISVNELIGSGL